MDFEFDYDDDGEETVLYYILGERPVKVTCIDSFPFQAETPDFDKGIFVKDNKVIKRINDSSDVVKVSENEFKEFCLSKGITPI
ncbi:MAG: hypothetical protein ACTHOO_03740 [Alcanivorax sp.]